MKNLFHSESEKDNARFVWQNNAASQNPVKTPAELKAEADVVILALETDYPDETIKTEDVPAARAAYDVALALKIEGDEEQGTKLSAFAEKLEVAEAQVVLAESEEAKKLIKESVVTMILEKLGIEQKEDNAEQVEFSKGVIDFLNTNLSDFENYMSAGVGVNAFAELFAETMGKMNLDPQNPKYEEVLTKFKEVFEVFIAQQKDAEEERKIKEANESIASFDLERVLSRLGGMGAVMDSIKGKLAGRVTLLEFKEDDPEYNKAARVLLKAELTKKVKSELNEWIKLNTPARDKLKEKKDTFYEEAPEFKSKAGNAVNQGLDAVTGIFKAEYSGFQRFKSDSILKQVFAKQEAAIAIAFVAEGTNVLTNPDLELDTHIDAWLNTIMPEGEDLPFKDLNTKFHVLEMDPEKENGKDDIQTLIDKMKTVSREYVGGEWEVKYESYVKKTGPEALDFSEWIDMQEISAWDRIFLLFKKFFTNENGEFDLMAFMSKKKEGDLDERASIAKLIGILNGEEVENDEDLPDMVESIRLKEELKKDMDEKPENFIFAPGKDDHNAKAKDYIKNIKKVEDLRALKSMFRQAGSEVYYEKFGIALRQGLSVETLLKMKRKSELISVVKNEQDGAWELEIKINEKDKVKVKWDNEEIQKTLEGLVAYGSLKLVEDRLQISNDMSKEYNDVKYLGNFNAILDKFMTGEKLTDKETELKELLKADNVQYFIKQLNKPDVASNVGPGPFSTWDLSIPLLKQVKGYASNLNLSSNTKKKNGGIEINPDVRGHGDLKVELAPGKWIDFDRFHELSDILKDPEKALETIFKYDEAEQNIKDEQDRIDAQNSDEED